jgi:murein DD-endopeptidase MepM/ murein hydrolase activator NlpD
VNDRHPSGTSIPEAPAYDASFGHYAPYEQTGATYSHTGYDSCSSTAAYGNGDPLFGALPGEHDAWAGHTDHYDSGQPTQHPVGYDAYGAHHVTYDTGSYDTPQWASPQPVAPVGQDSSGQWDATAWNQTAQFEAGQFDSGTYDTTSQWAPTQPQDFQTGSYDATAWNSAGTEYEYAYHQPENPADETELLPEQGLDQYQEYAYEHGDPAVVPDLEASEAPEGPETLGVSEAGNPEPHPDSELPHQDKQCELDATPAAGTPVVAVPPARRATNRATAGRAANRRRRAPAKRSALLSVAAPSVVVMGVAGIAAASVGTIDTDKDTTTQAVGEGTAVKPSKVNNELDTQLANLSADADDFADRASRTQERIDLKKRQEAERKRKAEEAARKEALRPKFALPVKQRGLSAYYGQAGINWMSVHTGVDFPVSYGTPVMAATDGTVRTQWNSAYGNMVIVTAADGTETWYCHLSSTRIRSGSVKAGDVIGYAGNSGNSTGPHLHFEVRPGGGSAVDPLVWLRNHGLDPT